MTWRVAKSLEVLLAEVNASAPNRSKVSDGSIGDAAHATRSSDHNPYIIDANGVGVVRARDFTHDPPHFDAGDLAEHVRAMGRTGDPRVRYVIWNRQIASSIDGWTWRRYDGPNPHDKHVHISVVEDRAYDSAAPWGWLGEPLTLEVVMFCKQGGDSDRRVVRFWQRVLRNLGQSVKVDGDYGPGTAKAVAAITGTKGDEINDYQALVMLLRLFGQNGKSLTLADIAKALTD